MKKYILFLLPIMAYAQNALMDSPDFRRALMVGSIIASIYVLVLLVRNIVYRYTQKKKSERTKQQNIFNKKSLNFAFVIISLLILGVAYNENFAQGLAIFGVIGAGLTIVLKELVLSFVAWIVIMMGSAIRLGDRIKVDKDGKPIIGDVIDISLTKITLYENITNDSVTDHKKAGRIIFVPNYFILTHEVYNYTHLSMKTIIDLVEINLSFDSNFDKAEAITLEVVESISGRYMDMAKRQYDILKDRYTLRNMPTYPKIVFYPSTKGNGITMGIWYITPYREILRLKSELTKQTVGRLDKEGDIHLMYTGNSMYLETNAHKEAFISKLT